MSKKIKLSVIASLFILPMVGFFISFRHFFPEKTVRLAQATDNATVAAPVQPADPADTQAPIESTGPAAVETADASAATTAAANETAAPAAVSCTYPSQILNLANWKQTLPTGSSKKPTEINQTELASYSSSQFFHPNQACNGVVFRAPVNGVTTSGSGYPRSELREMSGNGKSLASWATTSGTNSMFIDEAITAVPKSKKHVVAGQIHNADDDVVVIRLEYPKLFVDVNGQTGPTLDANYTLGKRFTVKFVAANGKISIFYNGSTTPAYTMTKKGSGNYFKAGAYTQSNCSKEKDCSSGNYGEVVIYKLSVQH